LASIGLLFLFLPIPFYIKKEDLIIHKILLGGVVIKIFLGMISLDTGLLAKYYSNSNMEGAPEQSTEMLKKDKEFTRIEKQIYFENTGYSFFKEIYPLWFFNELRFNADNNVIRQQLPFSSVYEGYLYIPKKMMLTLRANTHTIIYLDNAQIIETDTSPGETYWAKHIEAGLFPIRIVNYHVQGNSEKYLELSFSENERIEYSVKNWLFQKPYSIAQINFDRIVKWLSIILNMIFFFAIGFFFFRTIKKEAWNKWIHSKNAYLLLSSGVILSYLVNKILVAALSPGFNILGAGNDDLTYEAMARYIQFSGDWSFSKFVFVGNEIGPYYWQILYPYLLTIGHLIGGESLFPTIFMQAFAMLLIALFSFYILSILTKKIYWTSFLLIFGMTFHPESLSFVTQFFPIGSFFSILATLLILLLPNYRDSTKGMLLIGTLGGMAFGLSVLTRVNFLPWIFFILLWFVLSFGRVYKPILIFLTSFSIILMPFMLRNWIVAGEFVLISSASSSVNFIQQNPIPASYIPPPYYENWQIKISNLAFKDSQPAQSIILWILDSPLDYLNSFKSKFLILIGWTHKNFSRLILFGLFFLGTLLYLINFKFLGTSKRKDYLIPGGFVLSQIITLMVFGTWASRFSLALVPFLLIFSILPLIAIENFIRSFLKKYFKTY